MKTRGFGKGRRPLKLSYPVVIVALICIIAAALITGNRAEASSTSQTALAANSISYDPAVVRAITFSDAEATALLPLQGAQAHFLPGNKVQLTYRGNFLKLDMGATDGIPWAERVPEWLNLQQVDPQVIYYAHMNGGRVWMKGFPAWFDYKKYDGDLGGMPLVVAIETGNGWVTVKYIPQ